VSALRVHVEVWAHWPEADPHPMTKICEYVMDHDDPAQRRVLGEQCRNAFEGGQLIVTYPEPQP
jgi:hypothetical protein